MSDIDYLHLIKSIDSKYTIANLVGGKIIDHKLVEGIPVLIVEKTIGNETFYYEIQVLMYK